MQDKSNHIRPANLDWDATGNPYSKDYQDIYYSKADALAESSYIFLEANNLTDRWEKLSGNNFIIGECGFGGGLNFLNTCRLWFEHFKANQTKSTLYYLACDLHPFKKDDLMRLHKNYPELKTYSDALLKSYPSLTAGIHSRDLIFGETTIVLIFMLGDAKEMLEQIWQSHGFRVDAWYLDGFSPALNAKMWDENLCSTIAALSQTGTTFSTYSAAGIIKKSLKQSGFEIARKTGFANKRHMLVGKYISANNIHKPVSSTWFNLPTTNYQAKKAIIIGAGLAGCSTASELAKTGWQVTIIERENKIASKASGNPLGIVYCKLSNSSNADANYYLHSYLFAIEHYKQISKVHAIEWQDCGILQIAHNEHEEKRQSQAIRKHAIAGFAKQLNKQEASELSQINLNKGGLFFSGSGFLNPRALCLSYTQHDNISCITNTDALNIDFKNNTWDVQGSIGSIAQAPVVIIANSHDALNFQQSQHYPLLQNYGQIDEYKTTADNELLSCVVCAKGYILPATNGTQFIGGITNTDKSLAADKTTVAKKNIELTKSIQSNLTIAYKKNNFIKSRIGIRCSSPDYLPLVGPVENKKQCEDIYAELSRNAKKEINQEPAYEPGLFINVAHGSHGLSSTPLAARYLAALINKSPLPLSKPNFNCLHPIRYLISSLKKQRL